MSKNATIIVMDRLPNGRKPITIKSITCSGYILFSRDMDGKVHMRMHEQAGADPFMGMIGCIRTMGQLDALREAIRKHVEMFPVEKVTWKKGECVEVQKK